MPDVFVPVDTSQSSAYLNRLFTSNAIGEFTLKYYEENRAQLEQMEYEDYRKNFQVDPEMLSDLVQTGIEVKVPFDQEQYDHSLGLLETHLKAQIARRVCDNEVFYPIFNLSNETFQKALQLFDQAETLAQK